MQMIEPTYASWLLGSIVVTAVVFACVGYFGARRSRRRTRTSFALGVLCGVVAGPALRRRSRSLRVLHALALVARRQSTGR